MPRFFNGFDIPGFWERSDYARKEYVGEPLTDDLVRSVEQELGYKLPGAYVELMRYQNGGIPKKTNHRVGKRSVFSITGIYSIGREKGCSLCGELGSKFGPRNGVIPKSESTLPTARRQAMK